MQAVRGSAGRADQGDRGDPSPAAWLEVAGIGCGSLGTGPASHNARAEQKASVAAGRPWGAPRGRRRRTLHAEGGGGWKKLPIMRRGRPRGTLRCRTSPGGIGSATSHSRWCAGSRLSPRRPRALQGVERTNRAAPEAADGRTRILAPARAGRNHVQSRHDQRIALSALT